MMYKKKMLMIFIIALQVATVQTSVTCMDSDNTPVDWFIMYKLPIESTSDNPTIKKGLGYFYMDVNNPIWTFGKSSIDKQDHALAYTLQQIYSSKQIDMHVLYNDEFPNKTKSERHGHTKGVLACDGESGFWIVHSIPRFPNDIKTSSKYSYPDNGRDYGQSILCITLPNSQMDNVGKLFFYNRPFIYDADATDEFCNYNPNLKDVIRNKKYEKRSANNTLILTSKAGQKFQAFCKTSKWDKELYSEFIAPYYQSNLTTETWPNGVGTFGPYCKTEYKVYNNIKIEISDSSEKVVICEKKDHSKWAVTVDDTTKDIVCIGDINRQQGQLKRGGGTVCMSIPKVYSAFTSLLRKMDNCSSAVKPTC